MLRKTRLLLAPIIILALFPNALQAGEEVVFELRTYHSNKGKLPALLDRFRDHTVSLFEKHGMTNVGYWVPTDNEKNILVYLLSYPNKEAREKSWQDFRNDANWKKAYQASIEDGKLVSKIDSVFLTETDFSNNFAKYEEPARLFEMRTYTTADEKLPILLQRFRDHTCGLFETHNMTNLGYFQLSPEQENASNVLLYFLAHKNLKTAQDSWTSFQKDPNWKEVAAASRKQSKGPILVKKGVKSMMLKATDFSPIK